MPGLRKAISAKEYARNCFLFGFVYGITMFDTGFSPALAIIRGSYTASLFWSAVAILWGFAMVRQGFLASKAREA